VIDQPASGDIFCSTFTNPMATPTRRTKKTIRGFASTKSPRGIIRQAASDVARGQVDTEERGKAREVLRRGRKKR